MDHAALKSDLVQALKRFPPEMLQTVARIVVDYKDVLSSEIPKLKDDMMPHLMAAIMEGATGMFDTNAFEATFMEALADVGTPLPKDLTNAKEDSTG